MILAISSVISVVCVVLAIIYAASYCDDNDCDKTADVRVFWVAIILLVLTWLIGFGTLGINVTVGEPEITYVVPSDLAIGEKHIFAKLDTVLVKDRTCESNIYADVMAAKEKKQIMLRVDTRKNSYGNVILEIVDFVATNMLPVTNTVPELILEKK